MPDEMHRASKFHLMLEEIQQEIQSTLPKSHRAACISNHSHVLFFAHHATSRVKIQADYEERKSLPFGSQSSLGRRAGNSETHAHFAALEYLDSTCIFWVFFEPL